MMMKHGGVRCNMVFDMHRRACGGTTGFPVEVGVMCPPNNGGCAVGIVGGPSPAPIEVEEGLSSGPDHIPIGGW